VARSALKPRRASLKNGMKTGILEMISEKDVNGKEEIAVDSSAACISGADSASCHPDQAHTDRTKALNPSIQSSIQPSQPLPETTSPSATTPLNSPPAFPTDNTDIRVRSPVLRPSKHLPRHNHTPSPYNHNYTKMASSNKAAFPIRYIYIYIYMYVFICMYMNMHVYVYTYVCIIYMYVYEYAYICVYIRI
jgi:hypothetical protein